LGEAPRAYIVPKNNSLAPESVHAHLNQKVAPYKKLHGGIEFISAVPKAASGKILRRQLLNDYLAKQKG